VESSLVDATPVPDSGGARCRDAELGRVARGSARKNWSSIYRDELDRLANLRADVLITHEAPGYHRHGLEILDTLAPSMGVKVTVHEHLHDRLDSAERWLRRGFKSHTGWGSEASRPLTPTGPRPWSWRASPTHIATIDSGSSTGGETSMRRLRADPGDGRAHLRCACC
jgi:hypothetical protein